MITDNYSLVFLGEAAGSPAFLVEVKDLVVAFQVFLGEDKAHQAHHHLQEGKADKINHHPDHHRTSNHKKR